VHGSGYERIATPGCSDRTIRRRLGEWAELGLGETLHAAALRVYDQIIGLDLPGFRLVTTPTPLQRHAPCSMCLPRGQHWRETTVPFAQPDE
jgi:hypothetical protein